MKTKLTQIVNAFNKVNRQKVQFFVALMTIALLVMGAGAPDNGGLVGR